MQITLVVFFSYQEINLSEFEKQLYRRQKANYQEVKKTQVKMSLINTLARLRVPYINVTY